ncbi:MBL fold metallo-hydrolase [Bacillus tuaregi]|uniref:MBL fold metallo-hydrolase n=1 Tax=Bacillus tuaregi TaxID=1816695 RepID=UPI0008F857C8|nr:MBL fold metallo-hydrolase [Bacillus tuaregi]
MNKLNQLSMVKKVTEDIYLLSIPVPFGMKQMNCYLLRGESGFTVIDTGVYSIEGMDIWSRIMDMGVAIEKVVLTHYHVDHLGLAKWFQEKHGVPVYISNIGYREIKRRQKKDYREYVIRLFNQHGNSDHYSPRGSEYDQYIYDFIPNGLFDEGQPIRLGNEMYEAIWTPGHSADHFCFYQQKQQIMIVGDLVLDKISPVVLIESPQDINPLKEYFISFEKVEKLNVSIALPGHGKVIENVNKRMEEIRLGHEHRLEEMITAIKDEAKTSFKVAGEIYGKGKTHKSAPQLMATITRFIYLESIGKVKSQIRDGILFYSLAK